MSNSILSPPPQFFAPPSEDIDSSNEWGANCGPSAAAAMLVMSLGDLRPHLGDFEKKGFMNPTMMETLLQKLEPVHRRTYRQDTPLDAEASEDVFPQLGLVRIQWDGDWCRPGVPMIARYRKTHWIGVRKHEGLTWVYDINFSPVTNGWGLFDLWANRLVPWLIDIAVEGGNGNWWPTHCYELRTIEIS